MTAAKKPFSSKLTPADVAEIRSFGMAMEESFARAKQWDREHAATTERPKAEPTGKKQTLKR